MPPKQDLTNSARSGPRRDILQQALTHRGKRSLDRIAPEFWALAMRQVQPSGAGRIRCNGRDMSMFASNDYLGLGHHDEVREAALQAIARWGTSTSGSRLLNGTLPLHEQLENGLCALKQTESVALFQNGYMANLGTLAALLRNGDMVFGDSLVHTSITDGCRLAGAQLKRFAHQDTDDLRRQLEKLPSNRPFLVVVDGIYSMDGDFAPLPELLALVREFGGRLMVDDAHATGVAGTHGGGSAEHFRLEGVDIVTGTLSKAFASLGGYVAADNAVIRLIRANAHPFIYSTSPSAAITAAADKAMEIARREPQRRQRLWRNAGYLRDALQGLGLDTGDSSTPIIPLKFDNEARMFELTRALDEAGIFAAPVIFPACPKNAPRIRLTVTAEHTDAELDQVVDTLASRL